MARRGDSPNGARPVVDLAVGALRGLAARRARVDHPGLYSNDDNPWTDHLARGLRLEIARRLPEAPDGPPRHAVAAHWRAFALLEDVAVEAARDPLYDIAWRVYSADRARLEAQPLIAECAWRGGWAACAPACDRVAQGRAQVRLVCAMADPKTPVGDMNLAQACAFRIAAFAPKNETILLAFYAGAAAGWREDPGFTLFSYTTGRRTLRTLA